MGAFSPFCPVDIRVLPRLEGEAAARDMLSGTRHKLLVLAPQDLCSALPLTGFFTALQGDGHRVQLITAIPSNPSVADLAALLKSLRKQKFQPSFILAIGGGSCIDLAKGISALWHLPADQTCTAEAVRQSIQSKAYLAEHSFPSVLAMPTTAGTGSEVTHWATIWDNENRRKLSIDCPRLFPKAAVLIPEWMAKMPPSLTLSTGLDALSHAMEAFWAKARTPLSQALALAASQRVCDALPQALQYPSELSARQEMCMASLLAGLAFSQTRTTACHSISYPLTMLYGVPHGTAAALTLSPILRRNQAAVPEIAQMEALFAEHGGFSAWLQAVTISIQELKLSAFGVKADQLPAIVELTFTQGRMDNNPVLFSPEEVLEILMECF